MHKNEEKEKRPATFDDVLENVGTWNIVDLIGEEEWRDPFARFVEADTRKQSEANSRLLAELRDVLQLKDYDAEDCAGKRKWELWHDVDDALSGSLYKGGNKPHLLMGCAIGMRLCGLEIRDIRARMRWLI